MPIQEPHPTWQDYYAKLHRTRWDWASAHCIGQLDGVDRPLRPPVSKKTYENLNIIASEDPDYARRTLELIPAHQRNRSFGSLRISQALAQRVLGSLAVADRLMLLEGLEADCGRPVFGTDLNDVKAEFEFEVDWLNEPRPTSVDLLLQGPRYQVAIECKFTEQGYGECSRPMLTPDRASFETQHCNGSYSRQRERESRCSLTEIGVKYWEHLPQLFVWDPGSDHSPCPLQSTYQLARNALAACSTPDRDPNASIGHVLVVYDCRNPEFRPGGYAYAQFGAALAACSVDGLLRKVSWQALISAISAEPDLSWLVGELSARHGIKSG